MEYLVMVYEEFPLTADNEIIPPHELLGISIRADNPVNALQQVAKAIRHINFAELSSPSTYNSDAVRRLLNPKSGQ